MDDEYIKLIESAAGRDLAREIRQLKNDRDGYRALYEAAMALLEIALATGNAGAIENLVDTITQNPES